MNERYIRWSTPWLSRYFETLAFGNGGGLPLILFPTSFGRYYHLDRADVLPEAAPGEADAGDRP